MESIFQFRGYKVYLQARVGERSQRRGVKSSMARHLGCQPTYVSQVLYGDPNFSLEQADLLNAFFEHSNEEADYFLLLVQFERAATKSLRGYFFEKIQQSQEQRLTLKTRLGARHEISSELQARYYSSWKFAAIHIALTLRALRTREALAQFFKLPLAAITESLEFLIRCGLATEANGIFAVEKAEVRLGNDSFNILKHHTNWRHQAVESLDREQITDLHYSGVASLSQEDVLRVKSLLLEVIGQTSAVIKKSNAEELFALNLDFFSLKR